MAGNIFVVVDTTETFSDVMLAKTRWMQLLSLSANGTVDVFIPEIMLLETARHWRRDAEQRLQGASERISKMNSTLEGLRELGVEVAYEALPDFSAPAVDVQDFLSSLRARLSGLGVGTLGIPRVPHEDLVERDLAERKPFNKAGKGYRDALVWESIRALIGTCDDGDLVFFVTKNTDDYCDGEHSLHSDLKADIADSPADVRVLHSLDELGETPELKPEIAKLAKDDRELAEFLMRSLDLGEDYFDEGPSVAELVRTAVDGAVSNLIGDDVSTSGKTDGLSFHLMSIPSEIEDLAISDISTNEDSIEWQTYETYEGGTLLMQASVQAEVSLTGYVHKGSFHVLDRADIVVIDYDSSDHFAEVSISVEGRLSFQLRVEQGAGFVEDSEFEGIEPLEPEGDSDHPWRTLKHHRMDE